MNTMTTRTATVTMRTPSGRLVGTAFTVTGNYDHLIVEAAEQATAAGRTVFGGWHATDALITLIVMPL